MNKIDISTYIKSRRENIGMSQIEFAEKINVIRSTVIRYESGETEPGFNKFIEICEVLGMEIGDFI